MAGGVVGGPQSEERRCGPGGVAVRVAHLRSPQVTSGLVTSAAHQHTSTPGSPCAGSAVLPQCLPVLLCTSSDAPLAPMIPSPVLLYTSSPGACRRKACVPLCRFAVFLPALSVRGSQLRVAHMFTPVAPILCLLTGNAQKKRVERKAPLGAVFHSLDAIAGTGNF